MRKIISLATLLLNRLYTQKVREELPVDFEVEIALDQTLKIEEKNLHYKNLLYLFKKQR